MPATTKKQQKFFQLIKAIQEGKAEGSAKAQELAKTMNPESVEHYTHLAKKSNVNSSKLLNYALISSLAGLGGAGLYGLGRYAYDKMYRKDDIDSLKRELNIAENEDIEEEDNPLNVLATTELKALPSGDTAITEDMDNALTLKEAQFDALRETYFSGKATDNMKDSLLYGALTPLAMLAPGLLSYHFAKKFIDRKRNNNLSAEVEEAKKEFEEALSKESSELQQKIDCLYESFVASKQADDNSSAGSRYMQNVAEFFKGIVDGISPQQKEYPTVDSSGNMDTYVPGQSAPPAPPSTGHGPGFGPLGLLFMAGGLAGTAGLGGYMLMRNRLKDDPEAKKLKTLRSMLKKDLSATALESGISVRETPEGKKIVEF